MSTLQDYVGKITPWNSGKPNFTATVEFTLQPWVDLQALLAGLVQDFDLDVAVGAQLDAVGVRIGCSRDISVPLAGLYFSFGFTNRGFGQGSWKGPFDDATGILQLGDDDYRRLLRARILANSWDGSRAGAQAILDAFFQDPETLVFVEDDGFVAFPTRWFTLGDPARGFGQGSWHQPGGIVANIPNVDMVMSVGVSGKRPPLIYLALLGDGLIPIKPEAVRINYYATSVDGKPLFGFGLDNTYIGGLGHGTWGIPPYDPDSAFTNEIGQGNPGSLDFSQTGNSGLLVLGAR